MVTNVWQMFMYKSPGGLLYRFDVQPVDVFWLTRFYRIYASSFLFFWMSMGVIGNVVLGCVI
ncbi:hypothetical protein Z042_01130 [Chania multitudinisentens RB-25]|uniref:Uncharacterized protein n=1 Tax=Chania multitudinisentens RB-25 TaxID=1441930 RepID=W0LJF6_9GAMM|nr:hypothetical protein Z042_01130 [Chania multitudinisentens RB-25]